MAIDRDTTLSTLGELIRIDSRNPDLEAGAPGEEPIARHVAGLLAQMGWSAEVHDRGNHRANVVAVQRGTGAAAAPSSMSAAR